MTARERLAQLATLLLGAPPVAPLARRHWSTALRVIDYHDVNDSGAFDRQMEFLASHYHPVGEEEVLDHLLGGSPLPRFAVWVTFDDGDPSVVEDALPILHRHKVPATFYVCPGLIDDQAPPWWELVLAAGSCGLGATVDGNDLIGPVLVRALKDRPDGERRRVVAELEAAGLGALEGRWRPLTRAQLERWVDAGHSLGNHTWDHPCLDRCTEEEQRQQIGRADEWLRSFSQGTRPTFAYPNGTHTAAAEQALEEFGYQVALLSDHRLVDSDEPSLRMSRLRLDASAGMTRTRAVVSGAHSAGYDAALRRRLTGPALRDR